MSITKELLARAADMKEEGIGGWADTCIAAADRIAELERVAEAADRYFTTFKLKHLERLHAELRAAGYLGGGE